MDCFVIFPRGNARNTSHYPFIFIPAPEITCGNPRGLAQSSSLKLEFGRGPRGPRVVGLVGDNLTSFAFPAARKGFLRPEAQLIEGALSEDREI